MATLDLLSLTEAKTALQLSLTTHDTEVAAFVTAVSLRLDAVAGPVVHRTITGELHNGGRSFIRPKFTPVSSVTSVTEYVATTATSLTAEANDTKPAAAFLLDNEWTHNVRIIRRTSGADSVFPAGRRNIAVTYVAGRAANTAAVPELFKRAAALCLQHLWRPSAGGWAQSQAFDGGPQVAVSPVPGWFLPRAVLEVLHAELRPAGVA